MGLSGTELHGKGAYIETEFGQIYYEIEGNGPPLLLVSGGPGSGHAHYHPWFSTLRSQFTIVYFDNLGTGFSVRLEDPKQYNLKNYAKVIEALRVALGFDKITLNGLSFGSLPALQYLSEYSEHVEALIITNGHLNADTWQSSNIDNMNHEVQMQFPEAWQKIMELRNAGIRSGDPAVQALYGEVLSDLYWADRDGHVQLFRPEGQENENNYDVYLAFVGEDPEWTISGTLKGFNPRAAIAAYEGPLLVVSGRFDRITPPKIAYEIFDAFSNANRTIKIFENSGHRPWVEESEAYFCVLSEFLLTNEVGG